jgi:hypothetical protein
LHDAREHARCVADERDLLAQLEPVVSVRVAPPEAIAFVPAAATSPLRRRAIFLRVETSTNVVEGQDARVEVGVERDDAPAPLILPREHALAALAGLDQLRANPGDDEPMRFTPAREASGLLRTLADGIQTGYALFIVPFVMTTTLAGREMPTVERGAADETEAPAALRHGAFTPLARVLEAGGCSLAPGGGCARWFVLPRPEDQRAARVSLSFAIAINPSQSAVVRVALPEGATIEERVRAAFAPHRDHPLLALADARYTSICDRRAR